MLLVDATFKEARKIVKNCRFKRPETFEDSDGVLHCKNCKLILKESYNNISKLRHFHPADNTKICIKCNKSWNNPYEHFYSKPDTIDELTSKCKQCVNVYNEGLKDKYARASILIPKNIYEAIKKLRGKDTIKEFMIEAIRRELQRRAGLFEKERMKKTMGIKNAESVIDFECPQCEMISYHPVDTVEGYCSNCHDWTRKDVNR